MEETPILVVGGGPSAGPVPSRGAFGPASASSDRTNRPQGCSSTSLHAIPAPAQAGAGLVRICDDDVGQVCWHASPASMTWAGSCVAHSGVPHDRLRTEQLVSRRAL